MQCCFEALQLLVGYLASIKREIVGRQEEKVDVQLFNGNSEIFRKRRNLLLGNEGVIAIGDDVDTRAAQYRSGLRPKIAIGSPEPLPVSVDLEVKDELEQDEEVVRTVRLHHKVIWNRLPEFRAAAEESSPEPTGLFRDE